MCREEDPIKTTHSVYIYNKIFKYNYSNIIFYYKNHFYRCRTKFVNEDQGQIGVLKHRIIILCPESSANNLGSTVNFTLYSQVFHS